MLGLCQCSLIGSSGIYSGQYNWPLGSYSSETIIINYFVALCSGHLSKENKAKLLILADIQPN